MLFDKGAIVTGAATGVGEKIASLFAPHGTKPFLLDRDNEQGLKGLKR